MTISVRITFFQTTSSFQAVLRALLAIWCFLSLGFVLGCESLKESSLAPGATAPALELKDLDGKPASLNDFKGRVVLLNFLASWCAPCAQEMPELERLYQSLKEKGFTVVAIGVDDDVEALQTFFREHKVTFPFLVDRNGQSRKKYRISGFPETFLLDSEQHLTLFFENGEPQLKIIGPRDWTTPEYRSQIERLLRNP
ncbi:MAG: TlpA family protein disulfide reductase [Bdellovibrionales bacterium]|nr:TlpA family protein disulfide reductase [Bdellovibrionales bacterium]